MKALILLATIGFAAAQLSIQVPIERVQQWQQPQQLPEQTWNPNQNQWNQQPQQRPWPEQQQNQWNQQPQQRPWNNQVTRVAPQPVEVEPWLLRPEVRCPEPGEHYNWALIIPHWRDQQSLTLCMGGVGIPFRCPEGFVYVQSEQACVGNWQRFPFNQVAEEPAEY